MLQHLVKDGFVFSLRTVAENNSIRFGQPGRFLGPGFHRSSHGLPPKNTSFATAKRLGALKAIPSTRLGHSRQTGKCSSGSCPTSVSYPSPARQGSLREGPIRTLLFIRLPTLLALSDVARNAILDLCVRAEIQSGRLDSRPAQSLPSRVAGPVLHAQLHEFRRIRRYASPWRWPSGGQLPAVAGTFCRRARGVAHTKGKRRGTARKGSGFKNLNAAHHFVWFPVKGGLGINPRSAPSCPREHCGWQGGFSTPLLRPRGSSRRSLKSHPTHTA